MIVQIVRFKDGLDVISETYDQLDIIELVNPMLFEIRNRNLLLQHWLPLAVMKGNNVFINKKDILCVIEPNEDFKEYYVNMVEDLSKEVKKMKEETEDNLDVMEAIAELNTNKDINIH